MLLAIWLSFALYRHLFLFSDGRSRIAVETEKCTWDLNTGLRIRISIGRVFRDFLIIIIIGL